MKPRFIPLHTHSHYSLLEGVDSPEALLHRAAACGYSALALTDTNNLYGAVPFVEAARRHGIRPILGACLRHERQRCTVLIAEPAGYSSLCRILSRLHLNSGPSVPLSPLGRGVGGEGPSASRLDPSPQPSPQRGEGEADGPLLTKLLAENAEGLHVLVDDLALAESLRDAFGSRLWLEVVRPARSEPRERELLEGGARLGLRPVASVAAHFVAPQGHDLFRLITAVRQGTLLDRLPRRLSITPDHHLVDAPALYQRFHDLPEAVINTERLAEQCRSDVLPRGVVLPPARVPRAHDEAGYLRLLCERGLRRRGLPPLAPPSQGGEEEAAAQAEAGESVRQRLEQELHIINQRDLAGYFLVVRDIARDARRRGFSMALRGSAGNSLVCYLLGITHVDPLRFDLPLERFLHAGRPDLPDIDLDFDWKVRDQIIASTFERYGAERTAMISSHLFLQPRSAFREAGKVHGLSNEQISRLLETLSERVEGMLAETGREETRGRGDTETRGEKESEMSPRLRVAVSPCRSFPLEPERWPRLLADARRLLGRPHHLSIHPGGIIITPGPIENYVPLQRAPKGIIITQFEKDAVEHIGLVKIDLLGNRALSTVDEARRIVRESGQVQTVAAASEPSISQARPLALLQRGDTLGVNQLESPAMRHLLIQMRPRGLLDVIQALALIRPGAASIGAKERFIRRRRDLEPVDYIHPSLEPILHDTCGLMLYEDDALRVVQALTGLSAPEADRFRKQITKVQSREEATVLSKEFLASCARNGIPYEAASEMWIQLAKFNSYSFCKSHAVSYGLIAWEAVALKAHHPLQFWVAALNNNQGMYPRRVYVEAAKRAGIPLFLPCVNRSQRDFAIEGGGIRTGLSAIISLDEATREAILEDREQRGPYQSLAEFRQRVPIGPEALALLIQVGAFDFTGQSRPALALRQETEGSVPLSRERQEGDHALFSDAWTLGPEVWNWAPADYPRVRLWKAEWERLGFLVGPPLMQLFRPFLPKGLDDSRSLRARIGGRIRFAGLVAASRHTPTKHGEEMQFIALEDEWGLVDVTLFPNTCKPIAYLTMGPYLVEGEVEEQFDVATVTATRVERCVAAEAEEP